MAPLAVTSTVHVRKPARVLTLSALALALVLALLAYAIDSSQRQAHARIFSSFELRASSSARFIADFLSQTRSDDRDRASVLAAIVEHTISYREHHVYLVSSGGRLIAASPASGAPTIAQADPALARAAARAAGGPLPGARVASTFTVARVAGTPWRLLVAVPDSHLYESIAGSTELVPWLVFSLVSVLGVLLVGLLARSHADRVRLEELSERFERTARTDALTGLLNRRALGDALARASAHARRHDEPLSVLMIDLDRFKETNDRFGHDAGDRVLRELARCMRETLRGEDAYGRWGGDEFMVLLPGGDEREARAVAERLYGAAGAVDVRDIGLHTGVPMSVGAATARGAHVTPDELVRLADEDLYRVKSARREPARRSPRGASSRRRERVPRPAV
ncbi:MAG TPA: GGDEF domain-containing protein [Solirubrobacteraceae bacterium]|nr:GGDEF domain-containing protein [Solirubrobacteraceae bacterium]